MDPVCRVPLSPNPSKMSCNCMKASGDIRKLSRHFCGSLGLRCIHYRPVSFGKGTAGLTIGAALATAALYLASATAAATKLNMGVPSLELLLFLESSALLIYKNKWVRYKK